MPLFALLAAAAIPAQPALTEQIAARDADLFETLFLGCDPAKMAISSPRTSNSTTTRAA